MSQLTLVGRSSSHYTRVTRIFALELGIEHGFEVVLDMATLAQNNYAGNPLLKVPILLDEQGALYGTDNICRALVARADRASDFVLRGDTQSRVVLNAEELILGAMTAEVSLIMTKLAGAPPVSPKLQSSIENSLSYLDEQLASLQAALPSNRSLSFVETSLFCLVRHLPFRQILDVTPWKRLSAFAAQFETRGSAQATPYRVDQATSGATASTSRRAD